ncbi:MAG: Do family serine endopeptidase [Bacteroidales bacterium]|nr:Do family serine endopeptidase [Bacteroidales bacterium]
MKAVKFIAFSILAGFIGGFIAYHIFTHQSKIPALNPSIPVQPVQYSEESRISTLPDFTYAAEIALPAVVHIKTSFTKTFTFQDDFFSPFFDYFDISPKLQREFPAQGTGSGVIITNDGYILTNHHVINNAEKILVTLNDKREFEARLIGSDPNTDLALLKIDATNLPFLTFGNSDHVKVGQWVLAVGNPFNLTSTVTAGIVSAKARNINILKSASAIESFIQTDAAVNPGNSGGALVNPNGELIGIITAIATPTGAYAGYSFAIPSNIARKIAQDLMEYGVVQRAYFGASIVEVNAELAKKFGLSSTQGVYIQEVFPDGAAYDAGIDAGDVILQVDSVQINNTSQFLEIIAEKRPGDRINVTISRGNKILQKSVTLKNRTGQTSYLNKNAVNSISLLGATFEPASQEELKKLRLNHGIQITKLKDGILKRIGIKEGFIITKINQKDIITLEDLEQSLSRSGGIFIEGVYPNGMRAYYGFGL